MTKHVRLTSNEQEILPIQCYSDLIKETLFKTPNFEYLSKRLGLNNIEDLTFSEGQILISEDIGNIQGEEYIKTVWKSFTRHLQVHKWWKTEKLQLFVGTILTDKQVKMLALRISPNFHSIQKLELTFRNCSLWTGRGLEIVAYYIGTHLLKLKNLTLRFSQCKAIRDQSFKIFASDLTRHLDLKTFSIKLQRCKQLTPETFQFLIRNFTTHFTHLQDLELNFERCKQMNDQNLAVLGSYIGEYLSNIKKLNFCFWKCKQITDHGLQALGLGIKNKSGTLQDLSVDFHRCILISDIGIEGFISSIATQENKLKRVDFDFGACHNITDGGVERVGLIILNGLRQIQKIRIRFNYCHQVSRMTRDNLGTLLESIPNVVVE